MPHGRPWPTMATAPWPRQSLCDPTFGKAGRAGRGVVYSPQRIAESWEAMEPSNCRVVYASAQICLLTNSVLVPNKNNNP